MRIVLGEDQIIAAYVTGLTGDVYSKPIATVGVIGADGRIRGGFVLTQFTGAGVEVSLAGRGAVMREGWQAVGEIAFGELGCVRLSFHTRRSNKAARKQLPKFGAKFEGIARLFYGKEDGIAFSMLREEAIKLGYWRPADVRTIAA